LTDANANLTGDGTWTYGYDLNNRLKTAAKAGTSATLAYDAEGRLRHSAITIGSTATSNLLYDGVDLVAEYNAANVLQRRYVHGPGVDEPLVVYEGATTTAKSWLYADHLGSIVGTANATGTSTAIYSYGPYGEPNIATGQRFRYTGQQLISGLGLYYYKARFYSPALGRFLQTDPIGYADDLNLYAYVGGNPMNATDPSGLVANWTKGMTLTDVPGVGWLSPSQGASSAQHWSNLRAETGNQLYAVPQGIATLWAEHSDEVVMVLSMGKGGKTGGESPSAAYGRQAHKNYENTLGGDGYVFNRALPSGQRPDAVGAQHNIVRELKPDSPSGIRAGLKQLEQYVAELEAITKQKWQGVLDLYRKP
jgi:RHS repeat-associated protein